MAARRAARRRAVSAGGGVRPRIDTERHRRLVRRESVVRDNLGELGAPAVEPSLEPVGRTDVPGDPLAQRQALVADVRDEPVPEPVLGLVGHRGVWLLAHQVALGERAQAPARRCPDRCRARPRPRRARTGRRPRRRPAVPRAPGRRAGRSGWRSRRARSPAWADARSAPGSRRRRPGAACPAPPASGRTPGRRAACRRPLHQGLQQRRRQGGPAEHARVERRDRVVAQRRERDRDHAGHRAGAARVAVDAAPAGRCRRPAAAHRGSSWRSARRSGSSGRRPSAGPRRPARSAHARPTRAGTAATPTRRPPWTVASRAGPTSGRSASERRAVSLADEVAQGRVEALPGDLGRVGGEHAGLRLHDVGEGGVGDVLSERRAPPAAPADRCRRAARACW